MAAISMFSDSGNATGDDLPFCFADEHPGPEPPPVWQTILIIVLMIIVGVLGYLASYGH